MGPKFPSTCRFLKWGVEKKTSPEKLNTRPLSKVTSTQDIPAKNFAVIFSSPEHFT
jgi:hypothetical protein